MAHRSGTPSFRHSRTRSMRAFPGIGRSKRPTTLERSTTTGTAARSALQRMARQRRVTAMSEATFRSTASWLLLRFAPPDDWLPPTPWTSEIRIDLHEEGPPEGPRLQKYFLHRSAFTEGRSRPGGRGALTLLQPPVAHECVSRAMPKANPRDVGRMSGAGGRRAEQLRRARPVPHAALPREGAVRPTAVPATVLTTKR